MITEQLTGWGTNDVPNCSFIYHKSDMNLTYLDESCWQLPIPVTVVTDIY
jgi:hypothetical protein